jgi:hypothetical protein
MLAISRMMINMDPPGNESPKEIVLLKPLIKHKPIATISATFVGTLLEKNSSDRARTNRVI